MHNKEKNLNDAYQILTHLGLSPGSGNKTISSPLPGVEDKQPSFSINIDPAQCQIRLLEVPLFR